MKTKKYTLFFLIVAISIIGADLFLSPFLFPHISLRSITVLDSIILFLFILGTIIIAPGLKKEPKNFVGRFLVLTTVQMLSVLAVFAAVIYVKFPDAQTVVLHSLSVFILLMVAQSLLLLKFVNSK
ncbi:MAG: hypothetical protein HYR91_03665 [Flavobacteriia bacterium]|nr:hypothetical protein [Flavobacteriia bacterium]